MRALSTSFTFNCTSSSRRSPVTYSISSQTRCRGLSADSINRWTSSRLRTSGNRIGRLGWGVSSTLQFRFRVLTKKNRESRKMLCDRVGVQFPVGKQVCLVLSDLFRPQLVGWALVEESELLHGPQVAFRGKLGQIATLEFFQHHFS